ncbi:hypothetical protein [Rhizobium sp. BK176]|uniref:hypothetical protein n=1 Tax=Rhizobium sp. BK176 TaxID=2587071 RepID=UPI002166D320|nr:hypothetical protein [Rhizobium sp. BK176]MCS4090072.1 hypothetical protein [Rhizobium sp. BK176]
MFQLIVAFIAIALFAALTMAGTFYGGEAFTRAQEKAEAAARLKNGGIERTDTTIRSSVSVAPAGWVVTDSY